MQLEMFVATVEEGSVRKAARRVFRTQPAVSVALRKLETEIGAPLFDRSNRTDYILTDTGQLLYGYARRMLNLRDEATLAVQELHNLQSGRLRIGANESATLYLLPAIVQEFREKYPKIKIEIFRQLSSRLVRDLKERDLDFAILSFLPGDDDVEAAAIMRDELVLIVSPSHRLAGRDRVHIKELGAETFIAHNVRSPSREKVLEAFRQYQTPCNITIEIATIETIKKFVAMNLGAGFVPGMCVREEVARGELVLVPVDGFHYERTLWLVRRTTGAEHHAAQAFMRLVKSISCMPGPKGVSAAPDRIADGLGRATR